VDDETRIQDLMDRWEDARENGQSISPKELCQDRPDLLPIVEQEIRKRDWLPSWIESENDRYQVASDAKADPRRLANHRHSVGDQFDRYRLEELLGAGGFGEVWRAWDPELRRNVAIKIMAHGRTCLEEARKVAQLHHPGIVPVHDVGQQGKWTYLVSELVAGLTLAKRLEQGPLQTKEAVNIAVEVADALHYAHEQGIVHRDVKPGNILLDYKQNVFITDFGIAVAASQRIDRADAFCGTRSYMSPEQLGGESHLIDRRTDIYSLGLILFEMLTGQRPFYGTEEFVRTAVPHPRTVNKAIPQDLDAIVTSCLEIPVTTRCQSAAMLAERLRKWRDAAEAPSTPKVTIFPIEEPDTLGLLARSLQLYEAIFTDRRQLVPSMDVQMWLDETRHAGSHDPWREFWAVLHNRDDVGGFANVTMHVNRPWCFGGYLAVSKEWQTQGRHWSKQLLTAQQEHLRRLKPDLKGMIIEVQPFDVAQLITAATQRTVRGQANKDQVVESFGNLRKMFELQTLGFYVALGEDGYPLEYRQPSLKDALVDEHGCDLVLMVTRFDRREPKVSLGGLLDFVYDEVYGESYTTSPSTHIVGYSEELRTLKERIRSKAAGYHLGRMSLYTQLEEQHIIQGDLKTIGDVMTSVSDILWRERIIPSNVDLWF
jgi:serine/threonine protein kinase